MLSDQTRRRLRGVATHFHPAGRRWLKLLDSLTLDPDGLGIQIEEPSSSDFIICGAPRTGTTLLAAQLFRPPDLVTLVEPWEGLRVPPAELFKQMRREILITMEMGEGKLDVLALQQDGQVRWRDLTREPVPVTVRSDFQLGIKWPAFWRYLDFLSDTRFLVCVRDPFEVVTSFKRKGGRLVRGLEYQVAFHRRMNNHLEAATSNAGVRRALLYEYINSRIVDHVHRANVLLVRYERWFNDRNKLLSELSDFLHYKLEFSNVAIRPSTVDATLSVREIEAVKRECKSASVLGYDLDRMST